VVATKPGLARRDRYEFRYPSTLQSVSAHVVPSGTGALTFWRRLVARSSIPPGKRRSTLCGYLAGCLVLRFQRSNGQIPGYQAGTFPPPHQRIAYRVQVLGASGKAFGCSLSPWGGVILFRVWELLRATAVGVCFLSPSNLYTDHHVWRYGRDTEGLGSLRSCT